jgi:hypothetical protein
MSISQTVSFTMLLQLMSSQVQNNPLHDVVWLRRKQIGQGGFGKVFLETLDAPKSDGDQKRAVKVVSKKASSSEKGRTNAKNAHNDEDENEVHIMATMARVRHFLENLRSSRLKRDRRIASILCEGVKLV